MTFPFPDYSYPWLQELQISVAIASSGLGELISLEDAKDYLKETTDANNDLITSLIKAARQYAEKRTGRSLVKKDYILSLNRFPNLYVDCSVAIDLRFPPLAKCEVVKYLDQSGAEQQLLAGTDFQVDFYSEPARIAPAPGQYFWPATQWGAMNAVRVYYSAGYDPVTVAPSTSDNEMIVTMSSQSGRSDLNRDILEDLITAMKQTVLHWFVNRDVVIATPGAGGVFAPLPIHLDQIIDQHRLLNMALTFPR